MNLSNSLIKNNVLVGKENWLFLYNGNQNQFDFLLKRKKINLTSIHNFHTNIINRNKYLTDKGILYKHIIFPSKPLLKQRYLPHKYNNVSSIFLKNYIDIESKKYILYPLKELEKLEKSHSTFLKYGTHNTDYGYLEIVNYLLKYLELPLIKPDFLIYKKHYMGSDLSIMIDSNHKFEEEIIQIKNTLIYHIGNEQFLSGNTNNIHIYHNYSAITPKRVLIFGDSFFKDTLKYLSIIFKDILYIRSQFLHKDIIENFQPDIVLTGNAERYLSHIESDEQAHNFLLTLYGDNNFQPNQEYLQALQASLSYKYYNHLYTHWLSKISPLHQNTIKKEYDTIKQYHIDWKNYFNYNNIAEQNLDPILHYIVYWRFQPLIIHNFFDTKYYIGKYSDIRNSNINPLIHYCKHGIQEGRQGISL